MFWAHAPSLKQHLPLSLRGARYRLQRTRAVRAGALCRWQLVVGAGKKIPFMVYLSPLRGLAACFQLSKMDFYSGGTGRIIGTFFSVPCKYEELDSTPF